MNTYFGTFLKHLYIVGCLEPKTLLQNKIPFFPESNMSNFNFVCSISVLYSFPLAVDFANSDVGQDCTKLQIKM